MAGGSPTTFSRLFSNFVLNFPNLLDNFRHFKMILFYLCFCFVCYEVQSSSRQYKTLSPFLGGGCIKAIPRTALLLSKICLYNMRTKNLLIKCWRNWRQKTFQLTEMLYCSILPNRQQKTCLVTPSSVIKDGIKIGKSDAQKVGTVAKTMNA
jgi:hypothetical protein